MKTVIDRPDLTIYHGNADEWEPSEPVDFILTNPYGFMPRALRSTPAVLHQWVHRKAEAERWSHMRLDYCVGMWNDNREAFWTNDAVQMPLGVDVFDFRPEPGGWYPIEMVRRILTAYVQPGQTLWDGFMGRGTVGKVCMEMGVRYIGVEQLERHVALALDYLGVSRLSVVELDRLTSSAT